jgi:hypothetical protein
MRWFPVMGLLVEGWGVSDRPADPLTGVCLMLSTILLPIGVIRLAVIPATLLADFGMSLTVFFIGL